jgi:multidrug resistance efflux pump
VLASALLVPFSDARPQEARQSLPSSGQLLRAEGILRAVHEAALSAGVAEPIVRMPFKPGMAFRKGDVLVAFDCGRLRARLEAARARERALSLKAEAKRRLLRHMAAGKLDARVAEAEARQASAEAEAVAAEVTRCEIRAPWDGQVAEWFRHPHETPQAGERVLAIVASAPPEVDMIVPAAWLSWLRPGKRFQFRINALGVNVGGRVIRIGAVGDAVSQTVRITGRLQDAPPQALPGMGGTAMFGRGLALRGHDGL